MDASQSCGVRQTVWIGKVLSGALMLDLQAGVRPPPSTLTEPGGWAHGWQFYASPVSEHNFRKTVVLAQSCPSDQAHLGSHSGGGCSRVLHGCPTTPVFTVAPDVRLLVADARCDCGALTATGPLARTQDDFARGQLPEKTLARICEEAGATVRANVKLRDMNVAVRGDDERCFEVVASGLPPYHGAQLAVDITMRCAVLSSGEARPVAARVDGIMCMNARADKEQKYRPEGDGVGSRSGLRAGGPRSRMLFVSCAKVFATSAVHAVSGAGGNVPDATEA